MQKYEKLEKIGEGNGTTGRSCKIFFCRPFRIPGSPGSPTVCNTYRLRPQPWFAALSPAPQAQHSMQTAVLSVLAFPIDSPSQPYSAPCRPDLPTAALPAFPTPKRQHHLAHPHSDLPHPNLSPCCRSPALKFLQVPHSLPEPCCLQTPWGVPPLLGTS